MKNSKLNNEFIEQYKSVFADQLIQQNYADKSHLSGKDILQLTASKQFNFFLLKILFTEWQEEMKRLESPHFDYKHSEVRKSMVSFMNTLSQHIKIAPDDLTDLAIKALEDTLLITVSTTEYVARELKNRNQKSLSDKAIKQLLKYVVIFKEDIEAFLLAREGASIDDVLENMLETFPEIDNTNAIEDLVRQMSEVLVVEKSDLLIPESPQEPEEETVLTEDDVLIEEEMAREAATEAPVSREGPENQVEQEVSETGESNPELAETEEYEETYPEEAAGDSGETKQLREDEIIDPEPEVSTLNEQFEVEAKTLADLHEERKIDNIMDAISINHRYMFLQELFEGDNEKFSKAIEEVERCDTFDGAVEMLVQSYAKELDWDMNSDEVKELLKVIFRKFR